MIDLGTALWLIRHPSCRRCPRCRLTCEPRSVMALQGGVCHDCWGDDLVDDLTAIDAAVSTRKEES